MIILKVSRKLRSRLKIALSVMVVLTLGLIHGDVILLHKYGLQLDLDKG